MKYAFLVRCALPALLCLGFAPGCYRARHEARQLDEVAHLVFTGEPDGATASLIQDGRAIWTGLAIGSRGRYPLPGGTYNLVVSKDGRDVVNRLLFLVEGSDFEVRVP